MEEFGQGRTRIIVTELPYQVNKSRLVENIADQVKDKRLEGVSGLRDESDGKKGMRIVIELKKDANPQVTLNRLFSQTQMQVTFGVILLALVHIPSLSLTCYLASLGLWMLHGYQIGRAHV